MYNLISDKKKGRCIVTEKKTVSEISNDDIIRINFPGNNYIILRVDSIESYRKIPYLNLEFISVYGKILSGNQRTPKSGGSIALRLISDMKVIKYDIEEITPLLI